MNGVVGVLCGWRVDWVCGLGVWFDLFGGGIVYGLVIIVVIDDEWFGRSDKSISLLNEGDMVMWFDFFIWLLMFVVRVVVYVECDYNSCKEE